MSFFSRLFGQSEPEEESEITGIVILGPEDDEAAEAFYNTLSRARQKMGLPTNTYENVLAGKHTYCETCQDWFAEAHSH